VKQYPLYKFTTNLKIYFNKKSPYHNNTDSDLRACSESRRVQIFEHNFVEVKEKIRRHTLCMARIFDAGFGKICRKDVRVEILNRL